MLRRPFSLNDRILARHAEAEPKYLVCRQYNGNLESAREMRQLRLRMTFLNTLLLISRPYGFHFRYADSYRFVAEAVTHVRQHVRYLLVGEEIV